MNVAAFDIWSHLVDDAPGGLSLSQDDTGIHHARFIGQERRWWQWKARTIFVEVKGRTEYSALKGLERKLIERGLMT